MKPYYQDDSVTIYNADCRDVLPDMSEVDLVLTDPPYGIAHLWHGGSGSGWGNTRSENKTRNEWDRSPPEKELLISICGIGKNNIIWGGNYFDLPASRGWLVWNKPERNFSLAEAELAWTDLDKVIRVFDTIRHIPNREHPTQKPVELMRWCINQVDTEAKTILDPFMGSGTTLRAAKDLRRKSIGIEISEKYCEVAAKRMSQTVMNLEV